MQNSCIIDWELHQKVMAKKKTIKSPINTRLELMQIRDELKKTKIKQL